MKSTEEMLRDFAFLGDMTETAVIENTNLIAEAVESFDPLPFEKPTLCLPYARSKVISRALSASAEKYGEAAPDIIRLRIADEFEKIDSSDGWSHYLLAAKMSDKSRGKGYIHKLSGCVGSSFVSYLLGITETNPLPPHYFCPNCKRVEFVDETECASGYDLVTFGVERRLCPDCGTPYTGDGHNLPCEFFTGYEGDISPEFYFNFAEDIRTEILDCLEEVFGRNNTVLAGSESTIYGRMGERCISDLVDKYCEETNTSIGLGQRERIVKKMASVHVAGGRHPGAFLIVPRGYDISDFSPTRYTYLSRSCGKVKPITLIDCRYLPLERICMYDFTLFSELKLMEEYSGVPAESIDIGDIDFASYFGAASLEGISFGSESFKRFISAVKPTKFSDLVNIFGFDHGVFDRSDDPGELIGACADCGGPIAFREDVMLSLMRYGVGRKDAYSIAQYVRMGRARHGFDESQLEIMKQHGVPERLIASMREIYYLFPKAHAIGSVINDLRKVWYRINRPAAFFAAVLSCIDEFDEPKFDYGVLYGVLAEGRARAYEEYNRIVGKQGERCIESERIKILKLALECYDSGISFLPADKNASHAERFVPENGSIRVPYRAKRLDR